MSRLKERYDKEVAPALKKEFGYTNVMAIPKLEKIVVNMGLGEATQNAKIVDTGADEVARITGQKPVATRAKKSIAQFKLRQGMPVGAMVTLRGERMWEFLDRLISIALPRVRDFLLVTFFQAAHLSTTPSHLRQMRTFRPSPSTLLPSRVGLPHSGHTSCTFEAWSPASRSTSPPLMLRCGFGFVWRLMMFTPSTTSRFFSARTFSTRPRLPRSLPVMTTTLSFFRIGLASLDMSSFQCPVSSFQFSGNWLLATGNHVTAPLVPAK